MTPSQIKEIAIPVINVIMQIYYNQKEQDLLVCDINSIQNDGIGPTKRIYIYITDKPMNNELEEI